MKIKFINEITPEGYEIDSLTKYSEYEVIGIEADSYRIIDDHGSPYLFDGSCFEVSDREEPSFWICRIEDEGERYCYPDAWSKPGFFEDYFDGVGEVIESFWREYERLYEKNSGNPRGASPFSRAV